MKFRRVFRLLPFAVFALSAAVLAEPVQVSPISTDAAKDLLSRTNNQRTNLPKIAGSVQAVPIDLAPTGYVTDNHFEGIVQSFSRTSNRDLLPERLDRFDRRYLSLTDRSYNALDMPLCSLNTAPDTSLSYFSGILAGDAYKVWFDPSDCANCSPVYPFKMDSVTLLLVQDEGSPVDTVYIGIDMECARFDPTDPCRGPGQERCFEVYRIPLPADTDAFLQLWIVTLTFDDCWIDGPGFLGLWHFGHTLTDDIAFHPSIAFDAENLPPVQDCYAWTNLSGAWSSWASTWVDPDPGYPATTIYGECNSTPSSPVIPCPEACTQSRIGGSLAYYNTSVFSVWEWYGVSYPDLIFPYKPTGIDFSLYYPNTGAADDSVQVLITYGCSRLYDLCCVPSDILCAGSIWLTRGTASPTLLPVSLDLSAMNCCLQEEFWLGIYLLDVGSGDAYPSFLWSNAATDPYAVPECEQWAFLSDGTYRHWPLGDMGWAEMVLSGSCEECLGDTDNYCPPYIPGFLNCGGATPVPCGSVTLTGQSNTGPNNATQYCCTTWDESGPEKIYSINVPSNHNLVVTLSNISGGDVDVLILDACNAASCVGYGDNSVELKNLEAGLYYIIVDGYLGATASFDISVDCILPCNGQLCNTIAPGTVTSTSRYYDAEWSASAADTVFQSYWTTGTTQHILKWNPATCDTFRRVTWTSAQSTPANMLAYDPRNGGQFWTATATGVDASFSARFYRVSRTGQVL
ncbi:MAG: PPC domain-containing protein, partial [Calditrichota bacterium]